MSDVLKTVTNRIRKTDTQIMLITHISIALLRIRANEYCEKHEISLTNRLCPNL